jgi:hypothetical protein
MRRHSLFFALLVTTIAIHSSGCNEEIGPVNGASGFSGVMRFTHWPPADSVRDLRLVAFDSFPTDSAQILITLLAGGGAVYPPIGTRFPLFIDSLVYAFTTTSGTNLQVKNYGYVIVAQQYGPNILTDWQPAGVFSTGPGPFDPAPLRVLLHHVTPGININIDFHNLPPKPWR